MFQESGQALNKISQSIEFGNPKELIKLRTKELRKKKKKSEKKGKTDKGFVVKKKIPRHVSKSKRKRKKTIKKFVKTISDKNRDSNLSGSKEAVEDIPVDMIVHIKMNN